MTVVDNALQALAATLDPDHYTGQTYPGLTHVRTEILGTTRWAIQYLDVYLHHATGTYGGVAFSQGATEMQDQDPDARIVAVEIDKTPRFVIKRTGGTQ